MAITNKEQGVWSLDEVYNKINEGDIWDYDVEKQLFMWGYEQTGNNTILAISSPVQLPGNNWDTVYSLTYSEAATKSDNTLFTWGTNNMGQLGDNSTVNRSSPVQIPGTWATGESKFNYGAGYNTQAIKSDNTMWVWGQNSYGSLGLNQGNVKISSPTQLPGSWDKVLAGGGNMIIAIKTNGTLWSWGYNGQGELGHNSHIAYPNGQSSPKQVGTDTTWDTGCANSSTSHAIKTNGTLWSWGNNAYGKLGLNAPSGETKSSPTQIPGTTWSKISCQESSRSAVKTDGTFWTWGRNFEDGEGVLGHNNAINYSSPTQVGTDNTWTDCMSFGNGGHNATAGLKSDGTLWIWGSMYRNNPLNVPQNTHYSSPVQVPGTNWSNLSAMAFNTVGCIQGT
jgi:hypothetical protein